MKAGFLQSVPWRLGAVASGLPNLLASVPRLDTRPPGMAMYTRRSGVRKVSYRRSRVPRRVPRPLSRIASDQRVATYTRHSNVGLVSLVSGSAGFVIDPTLNLLQYNDLLPSWDFYRILGCVLILTPKVDPGNSGINPNYQVHSYCANDQQGEFAAVTGYSVPTSFNNQKYQALVAGKSMYYKFYPKMVTSIQGTGGTAANLGAPGKYNDWIQFNNSGVAVPHRRLLLWLSTTGGTSVQGIEYVLRITFQCKGMS